MKEDNQRNYSYKSSLQLSHYPHTLEGYELLCERPIFHHLKHRAQTHIFLCLLAYHLLVCIEKMFLDRGVHTSWSTIRKNLSTHQAVTIVLPTDTGKVLHIRKGSTPEKEHKKIYDTLNMPYEIMRPNFNNTLKYL